MAFRHVLVCIAIAAFGVFVFEPLIMAGTTPAIAGLSVASRTNLYNQVVVVAAALFGFMLTAITILVSLDGGRKIVKELHYGEGFKLLILNMLAAVGLLLVVTILAIVGASVDVDAAPMKLFEAFAEWLGVAALMALGLSLTYFSITTYKVAVHD